MKELISLAEQQEKDKDWISALNTYNKLYDEAKNASYLEKMAWCASRAAKYNDAIKYFEILTNKEPENAKWFYSVGYQFYMKQEWTCANEWFKKALEIYPNYLVVKYRYAYSLRQLCGNKMVLKRNEFWDALRQLQECEEIWQRYGSEQKKTHGSTYAGICFQKGKMLAERKEYDGAIEAFQKSLSFKNKACDDCCYQLSKAYLAKKDYQNAEKYIPMSSNKYYVTELTVDILFEAKRYDDAQKLLSSHIKKRRKDYLFRKLAEILIEKTDYQEAIKYANIAKQMNPQNHLNLYIRSKVLYRAGFLRQAHLEVTQSIECRRKKYSSPFNNGELLKKVIEKQISDLDYLEDNKVKLKQFLSYSTIDRQNGEIQQYNYERGFGFIISQDAKYFFHISSLNKKEQEMISEGVKVSFEPFESDRGLSAQKVKLVN